MNKSSVGEKVWKPISTPIWDAANESVNDTVLRTIWQGVRNPVGIYLMVNVVNYVCYPVRSFVSTHLDNKDIV